MKIHEKMSIKDYINLTWNNHLLVLENLMEEILSSGDSSDVTIICNDQVSLKAHKFILKKFSPIFKDMFTNSDLDNIKIPAASLEITPILEFIYCGKTLIDSQRLNFFLDIANKLRVRELLDVENLGDNEELDWTLSETDQIDIDKNSSTKIEKKKERTKTSEPPYIEKGVQIVNKDQATQNQCPDCSLRFDETRKLFDHISRKHDRFSDGQCPYCERQFKVKLCLSRHIRTAHRGFKYQCNQCEYQGISKKTVEIHIDSVHDGSTYPCSLCDFIGKQRQTLQLHINSIHNGVRYPCDRCDYRATQKGILNRHKKLVHMNSLHHEVTYPCNLCNYKATKEGFLRKHYRYAHEHKNVFVNT